MQTPRRRDHSRARPIVGSRYVVHADRSPDISGMCNPILVIR
eukprot:COSAG01_NODE_6166_length_3814_cov_46.365276_7_plen_42_part_00